MGKGADQEREISVKLSLWWSDGVRDDLFWRSTGSGGRATQRAKLGKRTANSYGDICATDAQGQAFLDVTTIESKRGFNDSTIQDLLDKKNRKGGMWDMVHQAQRDASLAGVKYWTLIHRRDRREAVFVTSIPNPHFKMWVDGLECTVAAMPESFFLSSANRDYIKGIAALSRNQKTGKDESK